MPTTHERPCVVVHGALDLKVSRLQLHVLMTLPCLVSLVCCGLRPVFGCVVLAVLSQIVQLHYCKVQCPPSLAEGLEHCTLKAPPKASDLQMEIGTHSPVGLGCSAPGICSRISQISKASINAFIQLVTFNRLCQSGLKFLEQCRSSTAHVPKRFMSGPNRRRIELMGREVATII